MLFVSDNTRNDADNKLINADKINSMVKINRQRFFQKNNIDPLKVVNIAGVHGNYIYIVKQEDLGKGALEPETRIKDTDGLITNIKNTYLMTTGADCFAVFFHDRGSQVIGIAHCGWRGILENIVPAMIDKFKENFNSQPENLKIWIGPGIKSCHFEVKEDVIELFEGKYKTAIIKRNNQYFIDLPAVMALQLTEAGVNPQKITEYPNCTFCQKEKWFSYRRDKPKFIEANAFIIKLK